jgi:hypothetical protein
MSSLADIPPEIDWSRINDPPESIELGEGGGRARIAFLIPWGWRYNFYDLVAGTDETFPLTGGGSIVRKVPLRHPDRPEVFFAVGCFIEGLGAYEGFTDTLGHDVMYSHARCIVDFATMPFMQVGDQPFAQVRVKHGTEYIGKPGSAFHFLEDNSKIEQQGGIFVATAAITITTFLNPTLDHNFLNSMLNRLNAGTFEGYVSGHVKYLGADTDSPVSAMGVVTHTKSLSFMYRELHWNYQMRADGKMDIPINDFTGLPTYQLANINTLLV